MGRDAKRRQETVRLRRRRRRRLVTLCAFAALVVTGSGFLSRRLGLTETQGWRSADIGYLRFHGSDSHFHGQWVLRSGGDGIWGYADAFHFVYRGFTGDGQITARVVSEDAAGEGTKAGVMIRENLSPIAKNAIVSLATNAGLVFQNRDFPGAFPKSNDRPELRAPYWVRLVRSGDEFVSFYSRDGRHWIEQNRMNLVMDRHVYFGLAVSARHSVKPGKAVFDHVSVSALTPAVVAELDKCAATARLVSTARLPGGWKQADVGVVSIPGHARIRDGRFFLAGSGQNVWTAADEFHFVYQRFDGDGDIIARVVSSGSGLQAAKVGVMFRESLKFGARNAFLGLRSDLDGSFSQGRIQTNGVSTGVNRDGVKPPYWLKLRREGDSFTFYRSVDGVDWKKQCRMVIPMKKQIYVGLAVTSHNDDVLEHAVMDHVMINRKEKEVALDR